MKRALIILLTLVVAVSAFAGGGGEAAMTEDVVLRYNNGAEPESLDPALVTGVPEHNIYMALFEGLVTYDPETLDPVPGVAERWESNADGTQWTFYLREDARWSDGVAITAQTVVDSWLRTLAPETASEYAYMQTMVVEGAADYNGGDGGPDVVGIRAIDDYTFQVDLSVPAAYFVTMLPHYAFAIHPLHVIEEYGDQWTRPGNIVSNGPFILDEWIPQDRIVVIKNDTYWDADAVQLDQIVFYPIDEENTSLNLFLQGQIDWIETVPNARLDEMKLRDDYHNNAAFITYYYIFNTTIEPLDDARVRRALSMAIDRTELVEQVTRGGQFPAFGLTPPLANYPAVVGFEEDFDEARRLLAQAGYPNGDGFPTFTILYNTSEGHRRIAEYVQQKWNEVLGIDVEILNQEWGTYLDSRDALNFDIARAGWQGDYIDPNSFLDMFITDGPQNDGKWSNAEYDELIETALTQSGQRRLNTLREAEELLMEELPIMPMYFYATSNWIDTDVWGGWYTNILDLHPFKNIYRR